MHRLFWTAAALLTALTITPHTALAAQDPQPPAPPARTEPRPEPRAETAAGQPVNLKLELTIVDQTGATGPLKKTVTLVIADRGMGSIRSIGAQRSQLNVDARPQILPSGAIRLNLGLEYNPRALGSDAPAEWSSLNEQLAVLLEPGKPLVVSQAADPASDRQISVEIRATVLK